MFILSDKGAKSNNLGRRLEITAEYSEAQSGRIFTLYSDGYLFPVPNQKNFGINWPVRVIKSISRLRLLTDLVSGEFVMLSHLNRALV